MTSSAIAATPPATAALEQLRVVGLAVRREMMALCSFVTVWLLITPIVIDRAPDGIPTYVDPADIGYVAVLLGLVTPLGVWKGESLFGESQLWSLPVDHARHARLKVAAGWVWLMVLVAFGVLSFRLFLELIGSSTTETRWVVTNAADPFGPTSPRISVQWSAPLWQWLLPFPAATAGYLAGSALVLAFRRPLYWAAGIWLALLVLAASSGEISAIAASADRAADARGVRVRSARVGRITVRPSLHADGLRRARDRVVSTSDARNVGGRRGGLVGRHRSSDVARVRSPA